MPYPHPTVSAPSEDAVADMLEAAVMDTETHFETSDGCAVESDGTCTHGHPTWLVRFGLI
jgi:hypothetical protein